MQKKILFQWTPRTSESTFDRSVSVSGNEIDLCRGAIFSTVEWARS